MSNNHTLSSSIEETLQKVVSIVLPSIQEFVVVPSKQNNNKNKKFNAKKDGLDLLHVKNGLLLSYLIDLTKLIQYQNNHHIIKQQHNQHKQKEKYTTNEIKECLKRLNEMKVIIEKIKPLEKKMRYQIDKLLMISSSSSSFALGVERDKDDNDDDDDDDVDDGDDAEEGNKKVNSDLQEMDESDPLVYRPNLDGFGNDDDEEEEDSDNDSDEDNNSESNTSNDISDDEEILAAKAALKAGRKSKSIHDGNDNDNQDEDDDDNNNNNNGLYKAPRLSAVPFAEKEKQQIKEERLLKKQRDRMKKSELLSTLKATYGDTPEEDDFGGGAGIGKQRESARRLAEREAEKTKYEEDAFVRLTTSRKEKKLRNKIMREEVSNLHSIADIGNLTAGVSMAFGEGSRFGEDDDEIIRVGGSGNLSSRHANGKRRRTNEFDDGRKSKSKKRSDPKNSFQRTLYGLDGGASGKKKRSKK